MQLALRDDSLSAPARCIRYEGGGNFCDDLSHHFVVKGRGVCEHARSPQPDGKTSPGQLRR
jgi:hypothetical protein